MAHPDRSVARALVTRCSRAANRLQDACHALGEAAARAQGGAQGGARRLGGEVSLLRREIEAAEAELPWTCAHVEERWAGSCAAARRSSEAMVSVLCRELVVSDGELAAAKGAMAGARVAELEQTLLAERRLRAELEAALEAERHAAQGEARDAREARLTQQWASDVQEAREEAMRALEQCDVAQRSAAEGWKLAEEAAAEGAPNAVVEPTDHPQPSPPFPPHVSPSPAKRKLAERVCPQVC